MRANPNKENVNKNDSQKLYMKDIWNSMKIRNEIRAKPEKTQNRKINQSMTIKYLKSQNHLYDHSDSSQETDLQEKTEKFKVLKDKSIDKHYPCIYDEPLDSNQKQKTTLFRREESNLMNDKVILKTTNDSDLIQKIHDLETALSKSKKIINLKNAEIKKISKELAENKIIVKNFKGLDCDAMILNLENQRLRKNLERVNELLISNKQETKPISKLKRSITCCNFIGE